MAYKTLPDLTEKQIMIIKLIYKFRFINRHQLQKLLNHKDPRRLNSWLKDLVTKEYLGRIYSHKLLENTKPAIYYLNNNGIIWVKRNIGAEYGYIEDDLDLRLVKKFYDDKKASQTFINHGISLCEVYIQLVEQEKKDKQLSHVFFTKSELTIWEQLRKRIDYEEIKDYLPDVYVESITEDEKSLSVQSFFLDLFDAHVPRYALRYKIDQYIDLNDSFLWKKFACTEWEFPVILLVLPTIQKLRGLKKYIKEKLERTYLDEEITFFLTTYEKMIKEGVTREDIWEEVVSG
jgi:hypothetical protein